MVPKVRVELTWGCPHRFLRPARLPFRHFGIVAKSALSALGVTVFANLLPIHPSQLAEFLVPPCCCFRLESR